MGMQSRLSTAEKLAPNILFTFTKLSGEYSDKVFGVLQNGHVLFSLTLLTSYFPISSLARFLLLLTAWGLFGITLVHVCEAGRMRDVQNTKSKSSAIPVLYFQP